VGVEHERTGGELEEAFRERLRRARPGRDHREVVLVAERRVHRERHQRDEVTLPRDQFVGLEAAANHRVVLCEAARLIQVRRS